MGLLYYVKVWYSGRQRDSLLLDDTDDAETGANEAPLPPSEDALEDEPLASPSAVSNAAMNSPAILPHVTISTENENSASARPTGARRKEKEEDPKTVFGIPPLTEADRFRPNRDTKINNAATAIIETHQEANMALRSATGGSNFASGTSSSPHPPFSSYFQDNITEDDILPFFDRRIYEGIKDDTPPLIRRAKEIIDKSQAMFKKSQKKKDWE